MLDAAAERFADKPAVVFERYGFSGRRDECPPARTRFGAEITLASRRRRRLRARAGDLNPIITIPRTRRARASRGRSPAARRRPGCSWA